MSFVVNYALQVCDVANNSCEKRFCSDSKTEITMKCVTSFFESIKYAAAHEQECQHNMMIYDDNSTIEVQEFLKKIKTHYTSINIKIDIEQLNGVGIMSSIRKCWEWMRDMPGDLVYQVQDDYLYCRTAIYQMIDIFLQVNRDTDYSLMINQNNGYFHWVNDNYRYRSTPRMVVPGKQQYWIQCYDFPCTFLTSRQSFNNHWDIYNKFLKIDPKLGLNGDLENVTINRIVVDRNVLGLMPINSVALHMQSELDMDPYTNWKEWWDSIVVI